LNLAVADHDRLIVKRRRARAVDHAHMRQGDNRRVRADKPLSLRRRILSKRRNRKTPQRKSKANVIFIGVLSQGDFVSRRV
jgi:hypothetical protein